MKKIITFIFAAGAVLVLTSCHFTMKRHMGKGEKITVMNKDVPVKSFERIEMAGGIDVIYHQGDSSTVHVECPEKLLGKIDVRCDGKTLYISPNSENKLDLLRVLHDKVKVYATSPDLIGVSIVGSGEFDAEDMLDTDRLNLSIAGSGEVSINNLICDELKADVAGSGDISIDNMSTGKVKFSIAGSGDIKAHLERCGLVEVEIAGSGDVKLTGHTKDYKQSVAGSGDIDREGLVVGAN